MDVGVCGAWGVSTAMTGPRGSPTFAGEPAALGHFLPQQVVGEQTLAHELQHDVPVLHVLRRHVRLVGDER